MHKALLILAACLAVSATGTVSNAADLKVVARAPAAPKLFSLRVSYPGNRPHGTAVATVLVCASAWELWDNTRGSGLYCQYK